MTGPVSTEALVDQIARILDPDAHHLGRPDYYGPELALAFSSARVRAARNTAGKLIAGPLAPFLAALQRVTAERDEARADRDALLHAANFKPGPLGGGPAREVILGDIAGMRPAMVEARRAAARVQNDADLWTMRMLEEWPGDTLLTRLWRQQKEATSAKRAAELALIVANAELAQIRAEEQVSYWRGRQRAERCLEDGVSEDGLTYTPIGDEAAWQGGYCNGRMSEADWWAKTFQYWPNEAARAATAREGRSDA